MSDRVWLFITPSSDVFLLVYFLLSLIVKVKHLQLINFWRQYNKKRLLDVTGCYNAASNILKTFQNGYESSLFLYFLFYFFLLYVFFFL